MIKMKPKRILLIAGSMIAACCAASSAPAAGESSGHTGCYRYPSVHGEIVVVKLGKTIGVRTWGGEIWLSSNNFEADGGIATAAELGVYGPEGKWLIEGHGVEPDIVIDNLPHATFAGEDAQLKAALDLLKREIGSDPRPVPPPPAYPNKAFTYKP
jgi:hypothetical protein